MHAGKQSLQPFQSVSAIEVRPIGSVLPHFDRANRPLALTTQMLLNPVAQVLDQMETIGDLPGLGRAYSGTLSIEPVAIAADDFHSRMLAKPARQRGRGAVRQHAGDGSGLKVHQDGSACGAFAPGPLINANNPQLPFSAQSPRPTLEMPKNSVAAYHDAKPGQQSARGFASSAMAHHRQNIGNGVTLTRVGGGETGQPLREDRALAARRVTTPFPNPEPYDHRNALHRQVVEASLIPAMLPLGDGPTGGTSWHHTALGLDEPAIPNPADRVDDHGWVRRTDALLCP